MFRLSGLLLCTSRRPRVHAKSRDCARALVTPLNWNIEAEHTDISKQLCKERSLFFSHVVPSTHQQRGQLKVLSSAALSQPRPVELLMRNGAPPSKLKQSILMSHNHYPTIFPLLTLTAKPLYENKTCTSCGPLLLNTCLYRISGPTSSATRVVRLRL